MNVRKTLALLAIAGGFLAAAVEPSAARGAPVPEAVGPSQFYGYAAPDIRFLGSSYQEPDGTYDSLSDFTRDVNGTPCGIECSARAQAHWGHYYAH
ncbi:hypothetical protein [Methyloferula stellata]|uniref:hypothetical protein n=1 Tax=Methyloferula stellata TaxID=876270 RepID=UPI000374CD26|nr:hypothetical protein [Methyloferula stellata]